MGNEKSGNGTALQLLQTILVAALLGVTGWLANAVIQNREDNVRLRTQFDERKQLVEELQKAEAEQVKIQQEILRTLILMKEADAESDRRLRALETLKQQHP